MATNDEAAVPQNDKCENCGACKSCGAGGRPQFVPMPYPVYPYPYALPYRPNPYTRPYCGAGGTSFQAQGISPNQSATSGTWPGNTGGGNYYVA